MAAQLIGGFFALSSALIYGSADFFGGRASRKHHPYFVLTLTSIIGTASMACLAWISGERWPTPEGFFWGGLAGITGLFGLIILYYGLANGNAAIVSPISGVVSACMPVFYTAFVNSLPSPAKISGFIIALSGIVLVTQANLQNLEETPDTSSVKQHAQKSLKDAWIGSLAGIFFGLFFICLSLLKTGAVFGPLAVSKFIAFVVGLGLVLLTRVKITSFRGNPAIIMAGLLDPIANALYLLATRFIRLDIAAVLASLYPAGTVFLAYVVFKEHINRFQWVGIALCLLAIILITS